MRRALALLLLLVLLLASPAFAQAPRPPAPAAPPAQGTAAPEKPMALRVETVVPLRGPVGRWGTPVVDDLNRRLYLPRGPGGLTVLSLDGFKILAEVADSAGSAAVALDPETLRGFSANSLETAPRGEAAAGPAATGITVFDQRNFKPVGKVDLPGVRFILYDAATKQVAALAEDGKLSLIDPAKLTVTATIPLDTKRPTGLVSDRRGRVFAAMGDRDGIAVIDMVSRELRTTWSPRGCRAPAALVFDAFGQRPVVACRGAPATQAAAGAEPVAMAIDLLSGAPMATFSVPPVVEAAVHDAGQRVLMFSSGTLALVTAFRQLDPYRYEALETAGTRPLAGPAAMDGRTARLIIPVAEYVTKPPQPEGGGGQRILPNSFALLVMKRLPLE